MSIGFWVFIELGSEERKRKGSEIEFRRKRMIMRTVRFRWEDGKGGLYCLLPQVWLHIVPPFD